MTNKEFQQWLSDEFDKYPLLARHTPHTINELVYVLRHNDVDYDMSYKIPGKANGWSCIPSVKECFIPVRDLGYHIHNITYEAEELDGVMYHHLELEVTK